MSYHQADISSDRGGGLLPRRPAIWKGCSSAKRKKLEGFYACAYLYAKSAELFMNRLASYPAPDRRHIWNERKKARTADTFDEYSGAPSHWFGRYAEANFRFVHKTFKRVTDRFEKGYDFGGKKRPVKFACLSESTGRCRSSLLANASIYGTIRVCPRTLRKPLNEGALVILHEMLHQRLGIGDQRDRICNRGSDARCYRIGARKLVRAGDLRKALRNNDNYAYFARGIYLAQRMPWTTTN